MIILETINSQIFKGEFVRLDLALWDKKRKPELTLTLDMGETTLNIPISQIKIAYSKNEL